MGLLLRAGSCCLLPSVRSSVHRIASDQRRGIRNELTSATAQCREALILAVFIQTLAGAILLLSWISLSESCYILRQRPMAYVGRRPVHLFVMSDTLDTPPPQWVVLSSLAKERLVLRLRNGVGDAHVRTCASRGPFVTLRRSSSEYQIRRSGSVAVASRAAIRRDVLWALYDCRVRPHPDDSNGLRPGNACYADSGAAIGPPPPQDLLRQQA